MRSIRSLPLAVLLLTGCQSTAPPWLGGSWAIGPEGTPAAAGTGAPTEVRPDAGGPPVVPTPAPTATVPVGSSGGGGASTPAGPSDPTSYAAAPADPFAPGGVTLPAASGETTLMADGVVPMSIAMAGTAVTVHPRPVGGVAEPAGIATVTGDVTGAGAGLTVQYLSRNRRVFAGTQTDTAGHFAFDVPVDAAENGLVLVRDAQRAPSLALARVAIAPGQTVSAGPMSLTASTGVSTYHVLGDGTDPGTNTVSAPPSGLFGADVSLQVLENAPTDPWRGTLVALGAGGAVPTYTLPGYTQVVDYQAASADGTRATESVVAPGDPVGWLAPPDLSALSAPLAPGKTLAWPAVPGARFYSVRLTVPGADEMPVWEGLTSSPAIALPGRLSLSASEVTVRVDAWDDAALTLYSVASLRAFRIPTGPTGPGTRHSWTRRSLAYGS